MIGTGTWSVEIKSLFYSGNATVTIKDNNGSYDFFIHNEKLNAIGYTVKEIKEEGNALRVTGSANAFPDKEIVVYAEFSGDTITGYADVPLLGKLKFVNGKRVH